MRNRVIDRCREFRRPMEHEQPLGTSETHAQLACTDPAPGAMVEADELWERLLRLCPPEHHEVLRLKREGASSVEIAEQTGLHEGSVRRILRQLAGRVALSPPDTDN
jgi:RNA polymerase sigma-70 factor (ECF subfamily)